MTKSKEPAQAKSLSAGEQRRIGEIIARLRERYPHARCSLNYQNAFELLIATILSAQCTDERVNKVTAELFRKYRTIADFAQAPIEQLEQDIHSTGFYRNKAKNIQATARQLLAQFGGEVPQTMAELLTLAGVARKTANVVLGNAFNKSVGVVVDTHVRRLSQRLALTEHENPEKIEEDLMAKIPAADWIHFPHLMIYHGRELCKTKPLCQQCPLAELCPSREDK
jgi:endonuclease III